MGYKSRNERLKDIRDFALAWDMDKPYQHWTIQQLAKGLNMKTSTHLRKMVHELCELGELGWAQKMHRPNVTKTTYTLSDNFRELGSLL